jgi:manganese/zinc/iron transport system substrate-binding protein
MLKKITKYYQNSFFLLLLLALNSCRLPEKEQLPEIPAILTTTGMLQDAVANVVGETAIVQGLMGPGVDPHLYKPTQGDLEKLVNADIVMYHGLHLEGKMGEVLEKLDRQKTIVDVSDFISKDSLLRLDGENAYDPHLWFDVQLWKQVVRGISEEMQRLMPKNAEIYRINADLYSRRLDSLHQEISRQTAQIPPKQRVLITAHDAFGYFGNRYNIEVRGLQGISTVAEYGLQDVTSLVDFLTTRKIKAIFIESSVPQRAIDAVVEGCRSRGHEVKIGGTLYSDALGGPESQAADYINMVGFNVRTIHNSLK